MKRKAEAREGRNHKGYRVPSALQRAMLRAIKKEAADPKHPMFREAVGRAPVWKSKLMLQAAELPPLIEPLRQRMRWDGPNKSLRHFIVESIMHNFPACPPEHAQLVYEQAYSLYRSYTENRENAAYAEEAAKIKAKPKVETVLFQMAKLLEPFAKS